MAKKIGFPALEDLKVPPGGLLNPKLREGFGKFDLGKILKATAIGGSRKTIWPLY